MAEDWNDLEASAVTCLVLGLEGLGAQAQLKLLNRTVIQVGLSIWLQLTHIMGFLGQPNFLNDNMSVRESVPAKGENHVIFHYLPWEVTESNLCYILVDEVIINLDRFRR